MEAPVPEATPAQLEWLFGLIVHDLRNPAATLAANLGFVRDGLGDPTLPQSELLEALSDSQQALGNLMLGLDQLSWIGRWFNERGTHPKVVQDLRQVFERTQARIKFGMVEFRAPEHELRVVAGEALERLLELLISNGHQHAHGKTVHVSALSEAGQIVVELSDEGKALSPDFKEKAFTMDGQLEIKGRADGRYGRVLGLFAAGILAQSLGIQIVSEERQGRNVFRLLLQAG
jgi:signal transduction histidine kinase